MNKTINGEQKPGFLTEADQIAFADMRSGLPARLSKADKAAFQDMAKLAAATKAVPGSTGKNSFSNRDSKFFQGGQEN